LNKIWLQVFEDEIEGLYNLSLETLSLSHLMGARLACVKFRFVSSPLDDSPRASNAPYGCAATPSGILVGVASHLFCVRRHPNGLA
jgi:hypothetical protein